MWVWVFLCQLQKHKCIMITNKNIGEQWKRLSLKSNWPDWDNDIVGRWYKSIKNWIGKVVEDFMVSRNLYVNPEVTVGKKNHWFLRIYFGKFQVRLPPIHQLKMEAWENDEWTKQRSWKRVHTPMPSNLSFQGYSWKLTPPSSSESSARQEQHYLILTMVEFEYGCQN